MGLHEYEKPMLVPVGNLHTAIGVELDRIGAALQLPRAPETDAQYRERLLSEVTLVRAKVGEDASSLSSVELPVAIRKGGFRDG
jgi:hypothetical protein